MSDVTTVVNPERVRSALAELQPRVVLANAKSARQPTQITIVAVTKGFGPEAINAALAAGLSDIGENYYQEAAAKFPQAAWPSGPARLHFIGRIQRNKARRIAALFDVVQTVDSPETLAALDAGAAESGKVLDVLMQVNVASDDRHGVPPDKACELAGAVRRHTNLRLRGIMALGPRDPVAAADAFAIARAVYDELQQKDREIRILSIGMSGDWEAAVRAGSTMLRLGTVLFGQRPIAKAATQMHARQ